MYKANQSKSSNFSSTGAIIFCVFLMGQVIFNLYKSIKKKRPLRKNVTFYGHNLMQNIL